ncbi:thioredoxin domain-containing protein [Halospeciosus flavus]|uniref:Thioredoxin domain-containing protein n=1 Tax=Halospeciosus flavus TaxID=3032283 RepID=A0ABD5Z1M5_9EURY|nr:thioredoxin domain-containing protein [Halospeciosus flavus]
MTTPTDRNRLDEEGSPYLRQHADNPVNWQPWDEQALETAKEHDVPIFLSIGYSSCHWCHVMEEESFEDEGVADLLNEHFVPIKVDREERPDLDTLYMTVAQQVTGGGGWPLSVWLTPEGKPFYVGTYFPPEPKRNQPGFRQLLEGIADSWNDPDERADLEARAEQWIQAAKGELEEVPDQPGSPPGSERLRAAADEATRRADRTNGGFGRSPKFPQPSWVRLLFRAADRARDDADAREYRNTGVAALYAMAEGGLRDHVGGGFHRYCVDADWTVPHFEKMLYDQAGLVSAYLNGLRATGDEFLGEVAAETLDFVERELQHPEYGFYSTLDARSEGEEGKFYVWTPEQVHDAVENETDAEVFCERYDVGSSNFEELDATVLNVAASVEELAEQFGMPETSVEERIERAREQVFDARGERVRPDRDEKVLAGWNGLMISAFAEAGLALDESYAETASEALGFVREHLWDAETGALSRRYIEDESGEPDVQGEAYLDDYAYLARGALDVYQATGDVEALAFALDLAEVIESTFWDADAGTLYFTPGDTGGVGVRSQDLTDQSTPSPTGVAAETLLALDHFAPDADYESVAERTLATHAGKLEKRPLQHATLVAAGDTLAVGTLELTVAADGLPDDWREPIGRTFAPDRLLSVRPPTEEGLAPWLDRLGLAEAPAIWAGREARAEPRSAERSNGDSRETSEGPTLYVCRRTCSPPLSDVEEAMEWVEEFRPA